MPSVIISPAIGFLILKSSSPSVSSTTSSSSPPSSVMLNDVLTPLRARMIVAFSIPSIVLSSSIPMTNTAAPFLMTRVPDSVLLTKSSAVMPLPIM